jgi:four helix bundle protein
MKHNRSLPPRKPYEIRARLRLFASDVAVVAEKVRTRGPNAAALCPNLVRAASSAAANAEEADDASTRRDFLAKERIALREVKETGARLRILKAAGFLDVADEPLIQEARELTSILATIIRNREAATDPA